VNIIQKLRNVFGKPKVQGQPAADIFPSGPITEGWQFVSIGFENDQASLDGLNPWQLEWHELDETPIIVPHPSYPSQRHSMEIYELHANNKIVKFAAGEFSNGVWGFYIPSLSQ
jgi:hypothetical protein